MNTIYLKDGIKTNKTVVAVGSFDGVHKGHAELIKKAVATAEATGALPAVWTFSDYIPGPASKHIIPAEKRMRIFKELGVAVVFTCEFDSVRDMSADGFVKDILIGACGAKYAVCGYNFRFGKNAGSDAQSLVSLMQRYGGGGVIIDKVCVNGVPVSSTAIRKALSDGDIKLANELLGRPFSIEMPVIHGKSMGKSLGFPTINQSYPDGLVMLKHGVYACETYIDGKKYKAVTDVGVKPTVGADGVCCESFILDYDGDLYGRTVTVYFTGYLRPERKFASLELLSAQIAKDAKTVKEMQ